MMNCLISEETKKQRVSELGAQLSADYKDKNLTLVCVLKGAAIFFADLFRALAIPAKCDFVGLSSYGRNTKSRGKVNITHNLEDDIKDRDVLIVEDIVDTGLSLSYLKNELLSKNPASLKTCCFLDKPARRLKSLTIEYVGFEIPNYFVVGYGLDFAEKYRNLTYIAVPNCENDIQTEDLPCNYRIVGNPTDGEE